MDDTSGKAGERRMRPRPSRWRPAFALCVALAALCGAPLRAEARSFRCPGEGGPRWLELTTAHFVVRSNLDGDDARAVAVRLERLRAALLKGISRSAIDPPGRVEVVVPRPDHFEEVVGDARVRAGGWFEPDSFGPRLVVSGSSPDTAIAAHELTHYLLAYNFNRLPLWLNEGLAEYFETIQLDVKKDGATIASVGRPPDRLALLPRRDILAARQARLPVVAKAPALFAWGTQPIEYDLERLDLYATAWASTHYLVNRQPAKFSQLLGRSARGEAPAEAWKAVFPEFDPAVEAGAKAFQDALEDYVQGSEYTYLRFAITPDVEISSEREMTDADVHVAWGLLLARAPQWNGKRDPAIARAQFAEALRVRPDSAGALFWERPKDGAASRARKAVSAAPEDWRAWMLLASSLEGDEAAWPERAAAYEKAEALAPENGGVLNEHAWALLQRGDSVPALPIAVRAVRASPWDAAVADTLGAVLADLGRGCDAVAVQQRAVELLPDAAAADASQRFRKRLADFQAQCRTTKR